MQTDVKGKVRNTILSPNKASLPLFECIVNSIHAIEEASEENGKIEVIIEKEEDSIEFSDNDENKETYTGRVVNITVIDNGIGFNEGNYNSFNRAETTHKINKGSKGVGRFIWLKSFDKVKVNSDYKYNGVFKKREFDFLLTPNGIENHKNEEINEIKRRTEVHLIGFKEKYSRFFPRDIVDITTQILEHCLIYLVSGKCPEIKILDKKSNEYIIVNDFYAKNSTGTIIQEDITAKGKKFTLSIIELINSTRKSKLHFCANSREVDSHRLTDKIPELSQKMFDENGNEFVIRAYLTGQYLDDISNQERTSLAFPKEDDLFGDKWVTERDLIDSCVDIIRTKYQEKINPLKEDKIKRYSSYIRQQSPQFKAILKYKSERLNQLKPNLDSNPRKLEVELFKIQQELELDVKKESSEVFDKIKTVENFDEYKDLYENFVSKIVDVGSSKLSQYVIHRKAVLDLLDSQLKINRDDSKYALENSIHKIIFPLKTLQMILIMKIKTYGY